MDFAVNNLDDLYSIFLTVDESNNQVMVDAYNEFVNDALYNCSDVYSGLCESFQNKLKIEENNDASKAFISLRESLDCVNDYSSSLVSSRFTESENKALHNRLLEVYSTSDKLNEDFINSVIDGHYIEYTPQIYVGAERYYQDLFESSQLSEGFLSNTIKTLLPKITAKLPALGGATASKVFGPLGLFNIVSAVSRCKSNQQYQKADKKQKVGMMAKSIAKSLGTFAAGAGLGALIGNPVLGSVLATTLAQVFSKFKTKQEKNMDTDMANTAKILKNAGMDVSDENLKDAISLGDVNKINQIAKAQGVDLSSIQTDLQKINKNLVQNRQSDQVAVQNELQQIQQVA